MNTDKMFYYLGLGAVLFGALASGVHCERAKNFLADGNLENMVFESLAAIGFLAGGIIVYKRAREYETFIKKSP